MEDKPNYTPEEFVKYAQIYSAVVCAGGELALSVMMTDGKAVAIKTLQEIERYRKEVPKEIQLMEGMDFGELENKCNQILDR